MNLVTDPALRVKVGEKFVAKLKTSDYHLTTGFLGTPWLLPALTSIDRSDLAYTMILKKDYPSWGYEIEHGATTMWERWNSIGPDGSFGDEGMNSFNHYAYGAVGDWMYQNIGAIKALEPGYKKIQVKPAVGGGLTHGSGHYDSVYGAIDTDWKKSGDDLDLKVDVPVNTTADIVLPGGQRSTPSPRVVAADRRRRRAGRGRGRRRRSRSPSARAATSSQVTDGQRPGWARSSRRRRPAVARRRPRRRRATSPTADADAPGPRTWTTVRDDVEAALLATLAGDDDAAVAACRRALAGVQALRSLARDLRRRRRRSAPTWTVASARSRPAGAGADRQPGHQVALPPVAGFGPPGQHGVRDGRGDQRAGRPGHRPRRRGRGGRLGHATASLGTRSPRVQRAAPGHLRGAEARQGRVRTTPT